LSMVSVLNENFGIVHPLWLKTPIKFEELIYLRFHFERGNGRTVRQIWFPPFYVLPEEEANATSDTSFL